METKFHHTTSGWVACVGYSTCEIAVTLFRTTLSRVTWSYGDARGACT